MGRRFVRVLALAAVALSAACQRTETVTRVVNLHLAPTTNQTCMIPSGSSGEYMATGDYDPPTQNHSSLLQTDVAGLTIDGIPENVASLSLTATPTDDSQWQGLTLVPQTGDVDMLLLPAASACALTTQVGFDPAMTFLAASSQTLIATGAQQADADRRSFIVDLDKGRIATMQIGMTVPRTAAGYAALSSGRVIVSGGLSNSVVETNAEVYDGALGDFDPELAFPLDTGRANHAAVTLANGAVLLAGGTDVVGNFIGPSALVTFDASKSIFVASESNSPPLTKRVNPTALRLADGNILVGGGTDASKSPVGVVEFLSADASALTRTQSVPPQAINGFVALEGGGALYVTKTPAQHLTYPRTSMPDVHNVWFVNESGATPLGDVNAPNEVKLFPRAGGGALLWNGSAWLAFDPWNTNGYFTPIANAPTTGPAVDSPITTSDPGMHAWVNEDGSVSLWRDSVRNEFASDDTFLTSDTGTALLAPDTLPAPSFDPTLGVSLVEGETVFVSDSRYLDVEIDVESTGASPPSVVLRSDAGDIEVGGNACPFLPSATVTSVHVLRQGPLVQFAANGAFSTCTTIDPNTRIAVGVRGRGGQQGSRAHDLHVARLAR